MQLIKTNTLIISSIILLQSCASQKDLHKDVWRRFHANLYQAENNKLYLGLKSFANMTGGGNVNFHYQDYGYYQTFSPMVEAAQGVILQAEMYAHGKQKLRIKDEKHLIFYFGEKKEEFLLTRENDRIEIKTISGGHFIQFERDYLNLLPERILQIRIPSNNSLTTSLIKEINNLGNPLLKLPLGNYSRFFLGRYSKENAHFSSGSKYQFENKKVSDKIYFFKMNKNYTKTEELVHKYKSYNNKASIPQLKYSFNFNIDQSIEAEKNGTAKMPMAFPKNSLRRSETQEVKKLRKQIEQDIKAENRNREISFTLDKPASVALKIFNVSGKEIKEIKMTIDSPGKINYTWDGMVNEKEKVTPGVYFYHLYLDEKRAFTKQFIILK